MSIEIENEAGYEFNFDVKELVNKVIAECMDYEGCPYEAHISVTFTDNDSIREINSSCRNIDAATDVLSFPMLEYDTAGDFSFLDSDKDAVYDCFDPDSGELILGDIIISAKKAEEQAEEYGHSMEREIAFLTAHSMFHLFGYDHMDDSGREIMEKKQREVLDNLGITR